MSAKVRTIRFKNSFSLLDVVLRCSTCRPEKSKENGLYLLSEFEKKYKNCSVPPEIVDVPASRTVNLGEIVSFECRAIGSPKPVITWFFDGSEIPHLRGRFSVSELRENVMVFYFK